MRYRSTIVYFLVALVLAGLYLYETRKEEKGKEAEEASRTLFLLDPDRLEFMALKGGDTVIELKKKGPAGQETWEIVSPFPAETDRFEITRLREGLAGLKYLRVIAENAKDLSPFDLETPSLRIAFRAGETQGTLLVGSKSPLENGFYALKEGEKRVFLISASDRDALNRSLFDLRDKRLFTLKSDGVSDVRIEAGTQAMILHREGGKWTLQGEEGLEIDGENLESLIRRTLWLEASSFESEGADDLKPFGLESPRARITLSDGKGTEAILIGDPLPEGREARNYARMEAKPQVVTIGKYFLENLPGSREDLLKKEEKPDQTSGEEGPPQGGGQQPPG